MPRSSTPLRILIVDDSEEAACAIAELLRLDGHVAETAHDGQQALERAYAFRPDLMLIDLSMPRLNGYQLARRLRLDPCVESLTLVAMTGWGRYEDERAAKLAGFDAFVVKPVDPDRLGEIVDVARGREASNQASVAST